MSSLGLEPAPPRVGLSLIKRAGLAALLICLATAGSVMGAVLLKVDEVRNEIEDELARNGRTALAYEDIDPSEAGEAQTIMLLGSDARYGDKKAGIPIRSDTVILVRLDPERGAISAMSLPRDLKVQIPGFRTGKLNEAYANGGPELTLRTIKQLTGLKINHVININFGGFRRAVNYIGGVYVDIDRRYFNDNTQGGENYATIDVQPGYQKLKGQDALDYVRYRHEDNDLVRAARQQDFLRQVRSQGDVKKYLIEDQKTLAKLFARYTDADKDLTSTTEVIRLLKLVLGTARKPVNEVPFRITEDDQRNGYLIASDAAVRETVREFKEGRAVSRSRGRPKREGAERQRAVKRKRKPSASVPGLEVALEEGEDQAVLADTKIDGMPVYFPRLRLTGSTYASPAPRVYTIRDEQDQPHRSYRMVVKKPGIGEFYGVQGTTWKAPPILDGGESIRRDGRTLRLYYDGKRIRMVAWVTDKGAYWVTNTLQQTISPRQMIALASSLQRVGER